MNKCYIKFSIHVFKILVEDIVLKEMIKSVFEVQGKQEEQSLSIVSEILILGNSESLYKLFFNKEQKADMLDRESIIYLLLQIIGDKFCSNLDVDNYLMHAAGVKFHDSAIAFSGVSGAGKTTSALLFSKNGNCFMGDEYAFLDMKKGTMRFENYPIQLKEGNPILEQYKEKNKYLRVKSFTGNTTYYFSSKKIVKEFQAVPLRVIVYPHYNIINKNTVIESLSLDKIPIYVLKSLMGIDVPAITFKKFVKFAVYKKIRFIEMFFSDENDMIEKLFLYLESIGPMQN